ncbi:MAG: SAM-dependent DNA methyltransferase [Alkalinema sp. RU_4_3]|nr:SAM-dependent DNA methyltransferase [Alkalinema sp. RU_4_3]
MKTIIELEAQRQTIQIQLDRAKTQLERNAMGQFATPISLANSILEYTKSIMPPCKEIRFLDPALGTGSFFSALLQSFSPTIIEAAVGYEVDEHYGNPSSELWSETILDYRLADFTHVKPPEVETDKFDLIICNPPYVRHHHINGQKERLRRQALNDANIKISGLAGLYCYFMAITHPWMKVNAIASWLIPSEFMDVNYGQAIKNYLLNEVTLLQIHRFDPNDIQFDDALVSSAIVFFQNKKPDKTYKVKFTYGGTIDSPSTLREVSISALNSEKKWTRFPLSKERHISTTAKLSDFFTIRRGIATGDNNFFVIPREEIERRALPIEQFRPILPSPRYLSETVIQADRNGNPKLQKQLFVLDCKLPIEQVKHDHPELYSYLQEGIKAGVCDRYLCRNRKLWYAQETRSESAFYCTYIGRSDKPGAKPFRFILNHSKAIVANSYLILYPNSWVSQQIQANPGLSEQILTALNQITSQALLDEGRVYGGGLHKMEPKELANVPALAVADLLSERQ